jgi:hypothetical protein
VNTSYNFKIQCETADATLKQLVGCHQSQISIQVYRQASEEQIWVQYLIILKSGEIMKKSGLLELYLNIMGAII